MYSVQQWTSALEECLGGVVGEAGPICAQVQERGYIPGALPDARCFGPGAEAGGGASPAPDLAAAAASARAAAAGAAVQVPDQAPPASSRLSRLAPVPT